jgi:hypothetical protein
MTDPTDIVERLNAGGHLDCEDGYYACPQAEGYFGEYAGTDECFCDLPLRREAATELVKLREFIDSLTLTTVDGSFATFSTSRQAWDKLDGIIA